MKAFVFIAYILIIVTLVYGADVQQLHRFYTTLAICADKLRLPEAQPNPQHIECMLNQYRLLNEVGILKKYEAAQYINQLISDPFKLAQMQQRLEFCSNYGAAGRLPYERILRLSGCLAPMFDFIDKL